MPRLSCCCVKQGRARCGRRFHIWKRLLLSTQRRPDLGFPRYNNSFARRVTGEQDKQAIMPVNQTTLSAMVLVLFLLLFLGWLIKKYCVSSGSTVRQRSIALLSKLIKSLVYRNSSFLLALRRNANGFYCLSNFNCLSNFTASRTRLFRVYFLQRLLYENS